MAKSDELYTPPWLTDAIRDAFGVIDLDPCASLDPRWRFAEHNFDKNADGLTRDWGGIVFMNPPYSNPLQGQFVEQASRSRKQCDVIVALIQAKVGNKYWFNHIWQHEGTEVFFIEGRIKFMLPDGTISKQGGNFNSALVYFWPTVVCRDYAQREAYAIINNALAKHGHATQQVNPWSALY